MDLLDGLARGTRFLLVRRGARARTQEVRGNPVHYYDVPGEGPGGPVVLVHGLGGSAHSFSRVLLRLRRRFSRILAPDLPGSGFSPLPPSGPLPLNEQVVHLREFLRDTVGVPSFVVGNSLGAALSTRLASESPELFKALALISPAGAQVAEERLAELLACFDVKTTAEARALTAKLFHKPPLLPMLLGSELIKVYSTESVRAICSEAKNIGALEPQWLAGLKMPVLLLWGESERLLPKESIDYFRAHLPRHSHIEVVRGFGHVPQVEHPEQVVRKLTHFADLHGL